MSNVLRLAIVDPNDASRETLKRILLGLDTVWLEAESSRYEFFADVVDQVTPDIAFVNLDEDPTKAIDLVSQLHVRSPQCSILVCSRSTDGNLILRAMRAGVREFLPAPVQLEDLVAALSRIHQQRFSGTDAKSRGCTVITIASATGGVGATSLAVNLGCLLASNSAHSVALVDLDLSLGDADVFLDAVPDYTLVDVAQNVARLDFNLLKRSLTKHSSGLYLLPRPVQLEDAHLITPDDFQRVMGLLKATFSHLIIDTSKSYSALDMLALQMATHVLLVTQLDLPCLRNVVRLMMSFAQVDGLKEKIKVVVNRAGLETGQISLKKAQGTIGTEIFWQVPNDYRVMVEVRNNGIPLIDQAPRAPITQSLRALADQLSGDDTAAGEQKLSPNRGWRTLFGGKTK